MQSGQLLHTPGRQQLVFHWFQLESKNCIPVVCGDAGKIPGMEKEEIS
jgi:hypothetical protein